MKRFFREHWLILLITLAAGILRFYQLSGKSFWVDEIIAALVASKPLSRIFAIRATDVTPPLRDYLAYFLFQFFGRSEFSLRLPSALFGTASIPLLYFIGKKWWNKSAGLIAAGLLTISPYYLYHSQDGRMYPVFIFLSLASLVFLLLLIESEQKQRKTRLLFWTGFIITTTLNIYLTYFAFWLLISELSIALVWLTWRKFAERQSTHWLAKKILTIIMCLTVIVILYIPWLPVLGAFISKNIHAPLPYRYTFSLSPMEKEVADTQFPFRVKLGWSFLNEMMHDYGVPGIGAYFYFAWFILGLIIAFYRKPQLAMFIMFWILIPLIILFLPPAKVLFFTRYISFIMPIYLLGIAVGISSFIEYQLKPVKGKGKHFISKIAPGLSAGIVFAIFLMLVIVPIRDYYRYEKQNWQDAVHYLTSRLHDGDVILVGPYNAKWCLLYYTPRMVQQQKQVTVIEKCNSAIGLKRYASISSRVWYISAYYRFYDYRKPAFFDWMEQHFSPPTIFPARLPSDIIYVFLKENKLS